MWYYTFTYYKRERNHSICSENNFLFNKTFSLIILVSFSVSSPISLSIYIFIKHCFSIFFCLSLFPKHASTDEFIHTHIHTHTHVHGRAILFICTHILSFSVCLSLQPHTDSSLGPSRAKRDNVRCHPVVAMSVYIHISTCLVPKKHTAPVPCSHYWGARKDNWYHDHVTITPLAHVQWSWACDGDDGALEEISLFECAHVRARMEEGKIVGEGQDELKKMMRREKKKN